MIAAWYAVYAEDRDEPLAYANGPYLTEREAKNVARKVTARRGWIARVLYGALRYTPYQSIYVQLAFPEL